MRLLFCLIYYNKFGNLKNVNLAGQSVSKISPMTLEKCWIIHLYFMGFLSHFLLSSSSFLWRQVADFWDTLSRYILILTSRSPPFNGSFTEPMECFEPILFLDFVHGIVLGYFIILDFIIGMVLGIVISDFLIGMVIE